MACLCCSSPAETILFGIVSNPLPSCLTRSVWLNAPRSLPDESYSSPSPGDRAMPGILNPIYVDLYLGRSFRSSSSGPAQTLSLRREVKTTTTALGSSSGADTTPRGNHGNQAGL